jgi:hypothetical protein
MALEAILSMSSTMVNWSNTGLEIDQSGSACRNWKIPIACFVARAFSIAFLSAPGNYDQEKLSGNWERLLLKSGT